MIETRQQQRDRLQRGQIASVNLELMLRSLVREILAGEVSKLAEFQQIVQFAPREMRDRIDSFMSTIELSAIAG
jgi:hypothetical protein